MRDGQNFIHMRKGRMSTLYNIVHTDCSQYDIRSGKAKVTQESEHSDNGKGFSKGRPAKIRPARISSEVKIQKQRAGQWAATFASKAANRSRISRAVVSLSSR